MSSSYIPERGDIVKLEFGLVEITADLIKHATVEAPPPVLIYPV